MGGGVVYSQVITELLDEIARLFGGASVDAHPEQFARSYSCYLAVSSLQYQVVVYRFAFGVSGERLILYNYFDGEALRSHVQVRLNLEQY
jgi:hypothetical protein